MPLRVKCRCGQEVVLRFNEWVYALFALLVLSLAINGAALIYLSVQLSKPGAVPRQAEDAPRPIPLAHPNPAPAAEEAPAPRSPPESPVSLNPDSPSAVAPSAAAPSAPAPGEPAPVPAGPRSTSSAPLPTGLRESGREAAREEEKPIRATGAREIEKRPERLLLSHCPVSLGRLLAAARADSLDLHALFLRDESPILRRFSLDRLAAALPTAPGPRNDLLRLVLPAAPLIFSEARGRELLRALSGEDRGDELGPWLEWSRSVPGGAAGEIPGDGILAPLREKAEALRRASPGTQALEASFPGEEAGPGADILLAIDVTESMEDPLRALQRQAWIFSALLDGLPGSRAGLLFYRDEVAGSTGFTARAPDLDRSLAEARAEGGGDVPEGVLEALRASLQLGRFDWRPAARKHIVFIGDGPPPRAQAAPLLALAKECHEDGGFLVHAVSVHPRDGLKGTPQFPELARAGGGRASTAPDDRVAAEVLLSIVPEAARGEIESLIPFLGAALR